MWIDVVFDQYAVLVEGVQDIKKRIHPAESRTLFRIVLGDFEDKLGRGFLKSFREFQPEVFYLRRQVFDSLNRFDATSV